MKRISLLAIIFILPAYIVLADLHDKIKTAIIHEDVITLLDIYNSDVSSRSSIENAIFAIIDIEKYSYSDINRFLNHTEEDSDIGKNLVEIKRTKELNIIRAIQGMTAEQVMEYVTTNPTYKLFVSSYLTELVSMNIDSLNYFELCYIEEYLPIVNSELIEAERMERKDELVTIIKGNLDEFCQYEKQAIEQLCYKLEQRSLMYLFEGYEGVLKAYALITFVPENPSEAESQYKTIVNGCLPSKELQVEMQNEVNRYCKIINEARENLLMYTGKEHFPNLRLTIPTINFNYSVSTSSFSSIREARVSSNVSRGNSEWVSSAVKMLGGSIWGMLVDIGRETYDSSKGEKLANAEYEYRSNYVMAVYNSIEKSVAKQNKSIVNGIKKEFEKNQKEFVKHVQK